MVSNQGQYLHSDFPARKYWEIRLVAEKPFKITASIVMKVTRVAKAVCGKLGCIWLAELDVP